MLPFEMRSRLQPNPSIERTASGKLRLPPVAAHVERWAPPACRRAGATFITSKATAVRTIDGI